MSGEDAPSADEHLPGCPAAISMAGAHEDCRCAELAALFRVPLREECFADPDPARAHSRWRETRAEAARRYEQLMRELREDEQKALVRYRETAADGDAVERDIRTARALLERERRL